jgi:predicted nucleotidyltransferase
VLGRIPESLPGIQAAFLSGSQASGRTRAESDIDVAVLLDTDFAPGRAFFS